MRTFGGGFTIGRVIEEINKNIIDNSYHLTRAMYEDVANRLGFPEPEDKGKGTIRPWSYYSYKQVEQIKSLYYEHLKEKFGFMVT